LQGYYLIKDKIIDWLCAFFVIKKIPVGFTKCRCQLYCPVLPVIGKNYRIIFVYAFIIAYNRRPDKFIAVASFIRVLIAPVKDGEIDIAIGSRFLEKSEFRGSLLRVFGIYIISAVLKVVTGKKVTDPTSGFCAMNKKAFLFFANNCADDYPEPQILLYQKDFKIKEISVSMVKRHGGLSSITAQKSIFYMLKVIIALLATDSRRRK